MQIIFTHASYFCPCTRRMYGWLMHKPRLQGPRDCNAITCNSAYRRVWPRLWKKNMYHDMNCLDCWRTVNKLYAINGIWNTNLYTHGTVSYTKHCGCGRLPVYSRVWPLLTILGVTERVARTSNEQHWSLQKQAHWIAVIIAWCSSLELRTWLHSAGSV